MPDLSERVILITGAAGTLGQAAAAACRAAGAEVVLLDRDESRAQQAAADIDANHCTGCGVDLTDPDAVEGVIGRIVGEFGRIDGLANVAGGFRMGPPLHETSDADWDFMLDLNLRTVFNTCRAVIPRMLAGAHGRIVNIAARAADAPKARMAPYNISKAGVITLTESLAAEHRDDGITVNCILPGTIDTPANRADMPDADQTYSSIAARHEVIGIARVWLLERETAANREQACA